MPLDPKAETLLAMFPPLATDTATPEEARRHFAEGSQMLAQMFPPPAMRDVEDVTVDTRQGPVAVRRYVPHEQRISHPVVFYHGGGFVLGDLESYHPFVSRLADTLGAMVFSVDYTLAPDAKFPQPVWECFEVTAWISAQAERWGFQTPAVIVSGDSAGGNFAAVVAQLAQSRGAFPVAAQLLFYPALDLAHETPSKQQYGHGYFLETEAMRWFGEQYLHDEQDTWNPLASPALVENVTGLPPAFVLTAEFDPLSDEGRAYAERLKGAGVPVRDLHVPGLIHGFLSMPLFEQAQESLAAVREFVVNLETR